MSYHPPETSVQVQTNPFYFAFIKAANTIGYFSLLYITWRFFTHQTGWQLATGCLIISGCWLALTRIKEDHLLQTYFDVLSRIELQLPVVLGIALSAAAVFAHSNPYYHLVAFAEVCGWAYVYALFRRNSSRFIKQGYGPVPAGTWINPPPSVLRPGDLILTSGNIAKELHESVGHAELVLKSPDDKLVLFSSYMGKGTVIHPIETVTEEHQHGHYIALHLREPWNEEQARKAMQITEQMCQESREWAAQKTAKYHKLIDLLPISRKWKDWLKSKIHLSGYDWFGTFMGRVARHHWTCIGACIELYHRMGVHTNPYGTGLLGFGTTLFDPILPVRFLADPAFQLVTTSEQDQVGAKTPVAS